jgi:hypothetical protein
MGANMYDQAA